MQPLQDDFRDPAAKDNRITNAATARSNLDAAIAIGSAETELQNTTELRTTASEIVAPKPDLDARAKKKILKHFFKGFLEGKSLAPKWKKSAEKSLWQPQHEALTQPPDTAGTVLQLQSTMEFHRQLIHQHHMQSHLQ